MGRTCGTHVRMRNANRSLDRKRDRKRLLGRSICIWKDAVKTGFKEITLDGLDWVYLAQDT